MALARSVYFAICPLEDCTVVHEAEPGETYFCPTCNLEMVTQCPKCEARVVEEDQVACGQCGKELKT